MTIIAGNLFLPEPTDNQRDVNDNELEKWTSICEINYFQHTRGSEYANTLFSTDTKEALKNPGKVGQHNDTRIKLQDTKIVQVGKDIYAFSNREKQTHVDVTHYSEPSNSTSPNKVR